MTFGERIVGEVSLAFANLSANMTTEGLAIHNQALRRAADDINRTFEAYRSMRRDWWTLAHELQAWRTREGEHSTSCQEGDGRGCWACQAFDYLNDVRTKTDESGALQRAIDDEEGFIQNEIHNGSKESA